MEDSAAPQLEVKFLNLKINFTCEKGSSNALFIPNLSYLKTRTGFPNKAFIVAL